MKYKLLILLYLIIFTSLEAQNYCNTKAPDNWIENKNKIWSKYSKFNTRSLKYIPIHYHIVRKDDKSNGYPFFMLMDLHCKLNFDYRNTDIQFVLDTFSYINSDLYFDLNSTNEPYDIAEEYNTSNHCNVYLLNDPAGNCGFTMMPSFFMNSKYGIYIQASLTKNDCSDRKSVTLSHEMGHWLDLPHTFYGWENGTPSVSNKELVARTGNSSISNCNTAGDGFCGTTPDYSPNRWNCKSPPSFIDPKGNKFFVDPSNFMCYSTDSCMVKFSNDQMEHMRLSLIDYNSRSSIVNSFTGSNTSISKINGYFPTSEKDFLYSNDNFTIKFDKIEKIENYNIVLAYDKTTLDTNFYFSSKNIILDTIINSNILTIPKDKFTPSKDKFIYWKVTPIHKFNTCKEIASPIQYFKLTDLNFLSIITDNQCYGKKDGKIIFSSKNLNIPIKYILFKGIKYNDSVENLDTGLNSFIIEFQNGHKIKTNIDIKFASQIKVSFNQDKNKITAIVTGGSSPYNYNWNNGEDTKSIIAKENELYELAISDSKGCESELFETKLKVVEPSNIKDKDYYDDFKSILFKNKVLRVISNKDIEDFKIKLYNIEGKLIATESTNLQKDLDFSKSYLIEKQLIYIVISYDNKNIYLKEIIE